MGRKKWLSVGFVTIGCLTQQGCLQRIRVPIEFALEGGLGTFTVEAGVASTNRGAGALGTSRAKPGSGSLRIDPDNIKVAPAGAGGGGKGTVNRQGGTLSITAWISAVDDIDTVCESGEQYGPFDVELNEDYQPVSVNPPGVTLSSDTIDLINGGAFSLCIEVVSPIDGTVTIEALSFDVGL